MAAIHQGCSHADGKCVDIIDYVGQGGGTVTNASTVSNVTRTLTFSYSGYTSGDGFSFVESGYLCNVDRVSTDKRVECTLKSEYINQGALGQVAGVYMEITFDGQVIGRSQAIAAKMP